MPRFRHKRHNRERLVSDSQAEGFRSSPHWVEIAEDAPDRTVSSVQAPDSGTSDLSVPDGTVSQILKWAGDDPDRRAAALYTERQGKGRTTLINQLTD